MNVASITRVRLLPPWRESSSRVVPDTLPIYPAHLQPDDVRQTKIWNASEIFDRIDREKKTTTIGVWFVYAPWMHMAWAWYYVGLVHLRDVPDFLPAKRQTPQMTHEFLVYALDPSADVIAESLRPLSPVNIVQQFDAASDAHALLIVEDQLEEVARGRISLDSDFRPVWRHRLCECAERPCPP